MKISKRVQDVSQSMTLALSAKAKQIKKQGIDVVGFGAGEPDFDTPQHIKDKAIEDIKAGFTKYTPASGIPDLKQAVCDKFKSEYGLEYEPSQVIVSPGAKYSLYITMMSICDPGDEVIIPAPYWLTYPEQVKAAGGKPVFIMTGIENEFKINAEMLKAAITDKTVALILNSPSNPTGAVYTKEELKAIADVVVEKGIIVISDEIYERLIYDDYEFVSFPTLRPELKDQTVIINGVSKTYSMTGWRIGYALGPQDVISAMGRLQSHSTSGPTSFCQSASVKAITGDQGCVEDMRKEFDKRRRYMVERLNKIPGVNCATPGGSFYVFPDVSGCYGKKIGSQVVNSSMDLANVLLEEFKVGVVPGLPFGDDNCMRLSYALGMADIEKGIDRIESALKSAE